MRPGDEYFWEDEVAFAGQGSISTLNMEPVSEEQLKEKCPIGFDLSGDGDA